MKGQELLDRYLDTILFDAPPTEEECFSELEEWEREGDEPEEEEPDKPSSAG